MGYGVDFCPPTRDFTYVRKQKCGLLSGTGIDDTPEYTQPQNILTLSQPCLTDADKWVVI